MTACPLGRGSLLHGCVASLFVLTIGACQREKAEAEKATVAPAPISNNAPAGTAGAAGGGGQTDVTAVDAPATEVETVDLAATGAAGGMTGTVPIWASWPVPNPPSTGLPHPARYEVGSKGTVLDKVTGLDWQQKTSAKGYSWSEARDFCPRLRLAGHADWRLPSRIELSSLVDVTRFHPSVDGSAFPKTPPAPHWTSSVIAVNPTGAAWSVRFDLGDPKSEPTNNSFRVRCVRAPGSAKTPKSAPSKASPAAPSYVVQGETVRDRGTGLLWQRTVPAQSFTFDQARGHCATLRLGGKDSTDGKGNSAWRVPSLVELLTLVDERTWRPTIDGKAFPKAATDALWTSSPRADNPAMAWQVTFEHGNPSAGPLTETHPVRCVR